MFEFCKRTIKSNLHVGLRWAVVILMVGLVATFTRIGRATPVTLGFEAEIVSLDELDPAALPFSVQLGDVLEGQFTFEPIDALPGIGRTSTDTVQEYSFSLRIGSTVLSTAEYTLNVRDNSPTIDAPFFTDHIDLGCLPSSNPSCEPGTVQATGNLVWGFSLPLTADGSVLSGADISPDPEVWNQFVPGFISATFRESGGANVLSMNARVTGFTIVPEPSSLILIFIMSFVHLVEKRRFLF